MKVIRVLKSYCVKKITAYLMFFFHSYRSSKGGQFDDVIDSDDDDAENVDTAGYSKSLVPSDTED